MIDDFSVQRALAAGGFYKGVIDGKFGAQSVAALHAWRTKAKIGGTTAWPAARYRAAFEQQMLKDLGFYKSAIDGIPGPATQAAVEKWQDYLTFKRRPLPKKEAAYQTASPFPFAKDIRKFYGEPGDESNLVRLQSPYPLYLDWDLSKQVTSFLIHRKVHDAALAAMNEVLDHYGLEEIHRLGLDQFGGCYANRVMRNGSKPSTHAWAIAIDWDADRNPLRATRRTALLATKPYEAFVRIWEKHGFVSLGRARDFDWMHFQALRL